MRQIKSFGYLGSLVNKDRYDMHTKSRIAIAKVIFIEMKGIMTNLMFSNRIWLIIFNCYIWIVLLYACEIWTICMEIEKIDWRQLKYGLSKNNDCPMDNKKVKLCKYFRWWVKGSYWSQWEREGIGFRGNRNKKKSRNKLKREKLWRSDIQGTIDKISWKLLQNYKTTKFKIY